MQNYPENIKGVLKQEKPSYIKVKIIPQSPTTEIVDQMSDGTYKIRVAAPPVKGAANEALCKYLKKALDASEVVIVSGARDSVKLIRINP